MNWPIGIRSRSIGGHITRFSAKDHTTRGLYVQEGFMNNVLKVVRDIDPAGCKAKGLHIDNAEDNKLTGDTIRQGIP
jgi:hypothetical protein